MDKGIVSISFTNISLSVIATALLNLPMMSDLSPLNIFMPGFSASPTRKSSSDKPLLARMISPTENTPYNYRTPAMIKTIHIG